MPKTAELHEAQQIMWARGNYARVNSKLVIVSEQLCESIDLHGGKTVLDVATGHGNTALAAARRECIVTGIDTVNSLMDQGRERAKAEGLKVDFKEGDAEHIPFPDESFDYVLSTFGVQFTTNHSKAASELIRVCKPKGHIGLVNWTSSGFLAELNAILSEYVPPPAIPSPYVWGERGKLFEFFGDDILHLEITPRTFTYRFPTPEAWMQCFRTRYGPFILAYESQSEEKREHMKEEIKELIQVYNRSGDETLILPVDYAEVIVVRR